MSGSRFDGLRLARQTCSRECVVENLGDRRLDQGLTRRLLSQVGDGGKRGGGGGGKEGGGGVALSNSEVLKGGTRETLVPI